MQEVIGLFPTPFMRVPGALASDLVAELVRHFSAMADRANSSSPNLSHTAMLRPGDSPLLVEAAKVLTPNRSEEHTSELQSLRHLVCRLLLEKKKKTP